MYTHNGHISTVIMGILVQYRIGAVQAGGEEMLRSDVSRAARSIILIIL